MKRSHGFTLLEVMVALAILSLSLTAIFSGEVGAFRTAYHADKVSIATQLARCKMSEIEETLEREGFPAISAEGTDGCCEDGEVDGYRCTWAVEPVEFADPSEVLAEEQKSAAEFGSVDEVVAGAGIGGGDMLGEIAMGYAWPILQPVLEAQVRRALVIVTWKEGSSERDFDVTQYLTQRRGLTPGIDPSLLDGQGP